MKNLTKLTGVKTLNKNEQRSINGGHSCGYTCERLECPTGFHCIVDHCAKCVVSCPGC